MNIFKKKFKYLRSKLDIIWLGDNFKFKCFSFRRWKKNVINNYVILKFHFIIHLIGYIHFNFNTWKQI
jgi:hypothetical protein